MMAAIRLAHKAKRTETKITLVNGTDQFVERVRLHQFAANQTFKERSIPNTLRGTGIQFVQGQVTAIHPDQRCVTVQTQTGGQDISYDYLVYALGSTIDRDSVPGVRDYAYLLTPSGEMSAAAL